MRYRLTDAANADIASILRVSAERHGRSAYLRYRALMTAALRKLASDPEGVLTTSRSDLLANLRSFHLRRGRAPRRGKTVARPVHTIFYRVRGQDIEIVRVLHERMDPASHVQD